MKNLSIILILIIVLFSGCQENNPLIPKYGVNKTTSEIGYLNESTRCSWDSLKLIHSVEQINDSLVEENLLSKIEKIKSKAFATDIYYFQESNLLVGISSNYKLRYVTYIKKGYPIIDGNSKHLKAEHRNQIIDLINKKLEGFDCEE